jgi:hypothetical protein
VTLLYVIICGGVPFVCENREFPLVGATPEACEMLQREDVEAAIYDLGDDQLITWKCRT